MIVIYCFSSLELLLEDKQTLDTVKRPFNGIPAVFFSIELSAFFY